MTSPARWYLNAYRPLVDNAAGRRACEHYDLQPFIDASIRREPDLENAWPTISAVCRSGKFAPRLHVGDVVVYLTVKGTWGNHPTRHRRLTAVLQVRHRFETHAEAAMWLRARGRPLPSNCLVRGNPPKLLNESHGVSRKAQCAPRIGCRIAQDRIYQARIERHGAFLVCRPWFVGLGWDAPVIEDDALIEAFGRVPGLRNPGALPEAKVRRFLRSLRIAAPPGGR